MAPASQQRSVSPRALVGKVLALNGAIFVGIGALIGGYILFSLSGAAQETVLVTVAKLLAPIFGGVGVLLLLVGLVLWLLPGNSPASNVVNQYYDALTRQDYSTAFQYLDPFMSTPQGTLTSAWFTQRAQAYDAENGRVIRYALAGVQANPGKRLYTIKVTRERSTYRTRLRLIKQGYDWKIAGFDRF